MLAPKDISLLRNHRIQFHWLLFLEHVRKIVERERLYPAANTHATAGAPRNFSGEIPAVVTVTKIHLLSIESKYRLVRIIPWKWWK